VPSFNHECDLFLLTSNYYYHADNALTRFARLGARNIDGWGIASYRDGKAAILRSADPAFDRQSNDLSREFVIATQAVSSSLVLGHLRLTSSGSLNVVNNHPFKLNFLEYDWTMIHNGTAANKRYYLTPAERLLPESDNDSARVFEFLRAKIIDYLQDQRHSLIEGCRYAYSKLLNEDPHGGYNIILSNGYISFIFIHHRPFYILNRDKRTGNVTIVSTMKLTENEDWIRVNKLSRKKAKMLVYAGPTLIYNGDIPR